MKEIIRKGIGVFALAAIVLILFSSTGAAANSGTVIGEYGGVPAVSNGASTGSGDGYYQCAEYVKRFYREVMSMDISLAGTNAKDYYETASKRDLVANPNSGPFLPQPDDVLAFNGTQYGHVAIITEVGEDYVTVIEQNVDKNIATHTILYDKTANRIGDVNGDRTGYGLHIQGWLRRPGVHIVDQAAYCGSQPCSPDNELIPGNEIKLVYTINNPYSYIVDYTILAAQIRVANKEDKKILYKNWNDEWIDISGNSIENNKIINLIPGTHEYTRKFVIPDMVKAVAGNYDVRLIVLDSRKDAKIGLKASNGNWIGSRVIKNTLKFKKVSQMPNPTITVFNPDSGENWEPGSWQNIAWATKGNPGGYAKVELLKDGISVATLSENTVLTSDGSFVWNVPATQVSGEDYQIRVTSSANSEYTDTSDGYFAIDGQSVVVVSPNGGEKWPIGTNQEIQWKFVRKPITSVQIELQKGPFYTDIRVLTLSATTNLDGNGIYSVTIPSDLNPGTDYKIVVLSALDLTRNDVSDEYFEILKTDVCSASVISSTKISALASEPCVEPPKLTTITVSPPTATFVIGSDHQLEFTATALDQNGDPIDAVLTWSVEDPSIGMIDQVGIFSAFNAGTTKVIASSGTVKGNATVEVKNPAPNEPIEVWNKIFEGALAETIYSVQQTSDGGYILAGISDQFTGHSDALIIKTDMNGNEQWIKTYGGYGIETAKAVLQISDGGYVFAGTTGSFGSGNYDGWLVKINSLGIEEWNQTFGGIYSESINSVQQTSDGGYILTGYSDFLSSTDAWLIKTDSSGREQWNRKFGGTKSDWLRSVQQTSDGGYILAGFTVSLGNNYGHGKAWLIKTDSSGREQWNRTFGGIYSEYINSVQQTLDSGYMLAGATQSYGAGFTDAWIVKVDSYGNEQWNKSFGGPGNDIFNSVQQISDGEYIFAGKIESFGAYNYDAWLVKVSE